MAAVSGAAQASFGYNGDGQRVVATEGITKTVFVGNYFEWQVASDGVVTTTETTKYYYAGGTRVAMQRGGEGTKYLLGDHLGSASVLLNADGTERGAQGYLPWGEVNFTEGTIDTEYTFTGQYSYVSSFGMAYFNARWFLPELGRFSQPDSIIPEQQQGTIAWDRHAGLNNNPVRYSDPSGHVAVDLNSWNKIMTQLMVYLNSDSAHEAEDRGGTFAELVSILVCGLVGSAGGTYGTLFGGAVGYFIGKSIGDAQTKHLDQLNEVLARMADAAANEEEGGEIESHFEVNKICDSTGYCYVDSAYFVIEGQEPVKLNATALSVLYDIFADEGAKVDERITYWDNGRKIEAK